MPRPQRSRRVCNEPKNCQFGPIRTSSISLETVVEITVDEYEVMRLIDYELKTQAQCAQIMNISRTTVAEIYERVRYKVADCIINGKEFCISGGNYHICDGSAGCGAECKCSK